MKQVIYGMVNTFIVILFIILLLIIGENGLRRMEVKMNLANAEATTMSDVVRGVGLSDYGNRQWVAEFLEGIIVQASDNESVSVSINELDANSGIMSASVKEEFVFANGNRSARTSSRTIIVDRPEEKETRTFSVSFFCDIYERGKIVIIPYKKYEIREGEKVVFPTFPVFDGNTFSYARYEDGGAVSTVIEDGTKFIMNYDGIPMGISEDIEIHGVYKIE